MNLTTSWPLAVVESVWELLFGLCFQFLVPDFEFQLPTSARVRFDLIFFGGWVCCLRCERGNSECQFRVLLPWGRALNLSGSMGITTIDQRQGEGSRGGGARSGSR